MIDISWPLHEKITQYSDIKALTINHYATYKVDKRNQSKVCMDAHNGTHIDAPAHFIENGKTLDQIDLEKLIGNCTILDLTFVNDKITQQDLQKFNIEQNQIILLKTKNSYLSTTEKFNYDFIYLDESGANYLVSKNIKSVGIDYLGIERNQSDHPTHVNLLKNDILIIEGLRLAEAKQSKYFLYCLPINLIGTEAAPARAILINT